MNLMPGAVWRPIPVSPSRPRRSKGRAVIFHVAASEATSLFGFFSTASVDSHLYVAKSGTIEQYVDLDLQAYASIAANASTVSVETQGGVTNPDGEPWTDAQVASLAHIARWAHDTEGVPLQLMPDSRSSSRGIGWHRLGIDPWRVPGGEVWSNSRGKLCPGAAKIAQVPRIVALAQSPNPTPGGDLSMADAQSILDFLQNTTGADLRLINGKVDQLIGDDSDHNGVDRLGDIWEQNDRHAAELLQAIHEAQAPQVDPVALAQALVGSDAAVGKLADALAAALAKRLQS